MNTPQDDLLPSLTRPRKVEKPLAGLLQFYIFPPVFHRSF